MEKERRKKLIQVNIITCSRIVGALFLIPIYHIFGGITSAIFCVVFFLSDMIDGKMARKYNVQTFLGALLDGTCDKVLAITSLILLSMKTLLMLIPIGLELVIAAVLIINFRSGKNVQTSILGKVKLTMMAISIVLAFLVIGISNNYSDVILIGLIFIPTVLLQLATTVTYALKKDKRSREQIEKDKSLQEVRTLEEIKERIIDTDFYLRNRDDGIKELFLKEREW